MDFSKQVKYVREQLKLSQKQLADALNVSFATINRWENAKVTPSNLAIRSFYEFCDSNFIDEDELTLIGYGELFQDQANQYSFPLPFNFSAQKMYRRLTVTLSSLTPIKPSTQTYRSAQVWFTLETSGRNLGLERINADNKAVVRGTIQHELFEGDGAVVWGEEDTLGIKINCRADANEFAEAIPYAIFATFEIAPEYNIDVYQRVVEKVKIRERITPR